MTMKQDLFQTKQNVSVQLSGKIPMLSSAGQVNVNVMVFLQKKNIEKTIAEIRKCKCGSDYCCFTLCIRRFKFYRIGQF